MQLGVFGLLIHAQMSGILIGILAMTGVCWAQQNPPKVQQGMGGIAGGLGAAAVYDAQKRPITAGGFVESGSVAFQDITKQGG